LQVLEEGRLTDSLGRKIDFRNTVIIMTSNVGAELVRKQTSLGFASPKEEADYNAMKTRLLGEVKKHFKPEFLNRIDDIIVFKSLVKEDLQKIINLEIEAVRDRLREKGIEIDATPEAIEFLIEKGYDPVYGARPLKRTIQRYIEDPLSEAIISGQIKDGSKVKLSLKGENLVFA
jgi:ATP-dependent Clp protease ATP-binding subunit ClpC